MSPVSQYKVVESAIVHAINRYHQRVGQWPEAGQIIREYNNAPRRGGHAKFCTKGTISVALCKNRFGWWKAKPRWNGSGVSIYVLTASARNAE